MHMPHLYTIYTWCRLYLNLLTVVFSRFLPDVYVCLSAVYILSILDRIKLAVK